MIVCTSFAEHPYFSSVQNVCNMAEQVLNIAASLEVEFEFVSSEDMQQLNNRTRGVDSVTDVLSFPTLAIKPGQSIQLTDFPMDINPETGAVSIGSIVVCFARAIEQAQEYGHSIQREVAYLAVHGLMHLLGYDHETEQDLACMRKQEEQVLNKLAISREST